MCHATWRDGRRRGISRVGRAPCATWSTAAETPGGSPDVRALPSRAELRTEQTLLPREAFFAGTESVPLSQAPGRVSTELVTPYPPDEVVNEAIVDYFEAVSAAGGFVEGAAGQTPRTLRVVR